MRDEECVALLRWALPRMGLRWEGFRKPRGQVCKRIDRRIRERGIDGPGAYRDLLEDEEEGGGEWEVLEGLCRVTISRFFRDRGVWRHLGEVVLPELGERIGAGILRAWSAGCGSGEEPYSLTILWALGVEPDRPRVDLRVVATDAGPDVLERARLACYGPGTLKELDDGWIERAFERDPGRAGRDDEPLCLRRRFREPVELRREDVRETMPEGPFDLVLCRNLVFTYFEEEAQARLLERMLRRLRSGGRLVLGAHEEPPPGEWPLRNDGVGEPIWVKDGER